MGNKDMRDKTFNVKVLTWCYGLFLVLIPIALLDSCLNNKDEEPRQVINSGEITKIEESNDIQSFRPPPADDKRAPD